MRRLALVLFLALIFNLTVYPTQGRAEDITIQKGSQVSFDYTLTVDGEVVETSEGKEPLQYTYGEGNIIPGLSRQLEGLKVGDEKSIEVSPEEAYGQVNPQAFQEVSKSELPPNLETQVGMPIQANNSEGRTMVGRIVEVKKDAIVVDFNHPFAGKTLIFQVKIVSIE